MANISNINLSDKKWNESGAGIVAVGVYDDKSFTSLALEINDRSDGALENAVEIGDVKGKNGEVHLFYVNQQRVWSVATSIRTNIINMTRIEIAETKRS